MRLTRANPFPVGVAFILLTAVVVVFAIGINLSFGLPLNLNLGLPPSRDYTLKANFDDANSLAKGANVVVAGNTIGQVTDVTAVGRQARVTMRIDAHYAPVHRGTVARIRYSTLLAQKYVELSPAAGTPALSGGAVIPTDQTITPVDFDQFLSTFDKPTRDRLQVVVQQAGGGVDGRGAAINDMLDQLDGLSQESRPGLSTLQAHDPDLAAITTDLAVTSNRLAQSHQQLGDFVANTADVTGTLASQDQQLQALIYHLANVMYDFDSTLNGNEQNFHQTIATLDPLVTLQLVPTLTTVNGYTHPNIGQLQTGLEVLIPEIGSAVSCGDPTTNARCPTDGNGNYLRQYLVNCSGYDSVNQTAAPSCTQPASGASTAPTLPSPKLPAVSCPTPPVKLPTITPTPLPSVCPLGTPIPTPGLPCGPSPTPTHSPTPSPTPSSPIPCSSIPSLPPLGSIPEPLAGLVGS
jgi:virulence factor Mce-like protein